MIIGSRAMGLSRRARRCARDALARRSLGPWLVAAAVLAATLPGGVASAVATSSGAPVASPAPPAASGVSSERPFSVQLHVHGSFSEGRGSIDSHSYEATGVGADVIWWSDHDFRITSYHHASTFGFEGQSEPLDHNEPWQGHETIAARDVKKIVPRNRRSSANGSTELTTEAADEGERSLRIRVSNDGSGIEGYSVALHASRGLFKRPLAAGVSIEISVFPENVGHGVQPTVEIGLSEHAPHGAIGLAEHHLLYVLDNQDGGARLTGATCRIPLRYRPGEWNRFVLPVTRDAVAGFPWLEGEDNSLHSITLGLRARGGAAGSALFDRFAIRQEVAGPALFDRQAELLAKIGAHYPALTQLQGVEISYASQHLNEFSVNTALLDYDALASGGADDGLGGSLADGIARAAVRAAHARGGLVSYNHMYGAAEEENTPRVTREGMLEHLLDNRLFGADLLEVGYRDRGGHPLEDHLWVWDRLAPHGLFPVGVGVSDSHGGQKGRWRTGTNNFLSWIYARSPAKADLLEGLRAGRVFFGDLVLFRGTVDLRTPGGFRMGQIVLTDRSSEEVVVAIDGLEEGDVVQMIESGRPTSAWNVTGSHFEVQKRVALDASAPTVVRVEVRSPSGVAKVLSNPLTFVRAPPPVDGIPAARAALEIGAARSRRVEGFSVTGAEMRPAAGRQRTIEVRGRGENGVLELELGAARGSPRVALRGLAGRFRWRPPSLVLEGLRGKGSIEVRDGA